MKRLVVLFLLGVAMVAGSGVALASGDTSTPASSAPAQPASCSEATDVVAALQGNVNDQLKVVASVQVKLDVPGAPAVLKDQLATATAELKALQSKLNVALLAEQDECGSAALPGNGGSSTGSTGSSSGSSVTPVGSVNTGGE